MLPKFGWSAGNRLRKLFKLASDILVSEKATVIIPALNEEKTILKVVQTALSSQFVDEVVVVDDGSVDNTAEKVRGVAKVVVVSHEQNLGKGRAIKTGIENASNEILLFLDADLENMSVEMIEKLLLPLLRNKADFVKAGFSLKRGRVTEFAIKPMMRILFPKHEFSQPISGQFGGKKSFLSGLKLESRWGIDISIFLDALKKNIRVLEVDIGELNHKAQTTEQKAEMSRQVMETMLKKTGLFADVFKAVVFSETTLFSGNKPKKEAIAVVKHLQKRRFKVLVLGYGSKNEVREKAETLSLDGCIVADPETDSQKLLSLFKKALKKCSVRIEETILVARKPSEEVLLRASGLGVYFGKGPKMKKIAESVIGSLPEIVLIEGE